MKTQQISIAPLNLLLGFILLTTLLTTGCGKAPSSNSSQAEPVAARSTKTEPFSEQTFKKIAIVEQYRLSEAILAEAANARRAGEVKEDSFQVTRASYSDASIASFRQEGFSDLQVAQLLLVTYDQLLNAGVTTRTQQAMDREASGSSQPLSAPKQKLLTVMDSIRRESWAAFEKTFLAYLASKGAQPDFPFSIGCEWVVDLSSGGQRVRCRVENVTALMLAASEGRTELVRKLLQKRANPNLKNSEGHTALHSASQNRHDEIAEVLRAAGAK